MSNPIPNPNINKSLIFHLFKILIQRFTPSIECYFIRILQKVWNSLWTQMQHTLLELHITSLLTKAATRLQDEGARWFSLWLGTESRRVIQEKGYKGRSGTA